MSPLSALILWALQDSKATTSKSDDGWDWKFGTRGLEFSPLEGVNLRLGGRIQYDIAEFDPDLTPIDDESDFRRVRWSFSGEVKDDWTFYVERDVAGTSEGWKEVWLRYRGFDGFEITAGNQVAPFSLDEITSSDDTLFLERALPNALAAGLYVGLAGRAYGKNWSTAAGYFGDTLDSEPRKRSEGEGVDARATYAPVLDKDRVVHVGASVEYRNVDSGSRYRIRQRPEVGITDVRLIDTRNINDVKDTWSYGVEAAATRGPFSGQAEYIESSLDREFTDVQFGGWYAQAGWVVTGEHRPYNARLGRLRGIQPDSRFGAVEVGARWSNLDLSDGNIFGGEESNATLGLNWYISVNVELMVDYTWIHASPNRFGLDEDPEVLQARLQIAF